MHSAPAAEVTKASTNDLLLLFEDTTDNTLHARSFKAIRGGGFCSFAPAAAVKKKNFNFFDSIDRKDRDVS